MRIDETLVSAGIVSCILTCQRGLLIRRIVRVLNGRVIKDSSRSIRVLSEIPLTKCVTAAARMLNVSTTNFHDEC